MEKHVSLRISGLVQGVFFRAFTLEKALSLGLKGFALNDSDGTLYIEAQGDQAKLAQFVEWCQKGPQRARVDRIEMEERNLEDFKTFEIKK